MRPLTRRTLTATTGTLVAALALAACTGVSSAYRDYPIFEREATAADQPPQDILDQMNEVSTDDGRPEVESARLVGTYEDVSLWLVKTVAAGNVCLIAASSGEEDWVAGCGAPHNGEVMRADLGTFGWHADDVEVPSTATPISENVYVYTG